MSALRSWNERRLIRKRARANGWTLTGEVCDFAGCGRPIYLVPERWTAPHTLIPEAKVCAIVLTGPHPIGPDHDKDIAAPSATGGDS